MKGERGGGGESQAELMKRQRQKATEKDPVERANESETASAGRRRREALL